MNIYTYMKNTLMQCVTCMEYQQIQQHKKTVPHEVPCKPLEVVCANIIFVKNKTLLCIVDYNSKFPIVRKAYSLAADDLVKAAKLVFTEFALPKNNISDTGTRYHHLSNGHVEACINFIKCTIKMH